MNYAQLVAAANYERVQSQSQYISDPFYAHACGFERTPFVSQPHLRSEVNVEVLIHTMETEAYASVLKALVAQSDSLTWEKEVLMTMLRKELNITDTEHGELLVKMKSDESIKMIRESQKSALSAERIFCTQLNSPSIALDLPGDISYKRLKASPSPAAAAAAAPKCIKYTLHGQPSSAATLSHFPEQFMDERQGDQMTIVSAGAAKEPMEVVCRNSQAQKIKKVKGPHKSQLKKDCNVSGAGNVKKPSNVIQIRATDMLIQEVERVMYDKKRPSPSQLEKIKVLLKEHERAICGALAKIAVILNRDQSQHHKYHNEHPGSTGRGLTSYVDYNGHGQGFVQINSEGRRACFIDIE